MSKPPKPSVPSTPISKGKSKTAISGSASSSTSSTLNSNNAPPPAAILIANDISLDVPGFRDVTSKEEKLMKISSDMKDLSWDGQGGYESCLEHLTKVGKFIVRAKLSEEETMLALSLNLKKEAKKLFDHLQQESWECYVKELGRLYFGKVTQSSIVGKVYEVRQGRQETVSAYFNRMKMVWNHASDLDCAMTETGAMKHWMGNVHADWFACNQGYMLLMKSKVNTFKDIEDYILNNSEAEVPVLDLPANNTTTPSTSGKQPSARKKNPPGKGCWKCGAEDHLKKDCPEKGTTSGKGSNSGGTGQQLAPQTAPTARTATTTPTKPLQQGNSTRGE